MFKKPAACLALLLGITSMAAHAADTFKVDLSVSRQGVIVDQPSIQVAAGRDADLTITPPGAPGDKAIRLMVSVSAAEAGTVGLHMLVFDRVNGEWTLRAEPSVKAKLGSNVQLTIGTKGLARAASPIDLKVTVAAG
ncbi:hypothetical protein [Luteibacter yeojuensis]|uniref:Uncharacterized protein n=1 Tax=Luteibacter yeojuensis TaxID=345309 RepID=A0A0F3KS66_9GAMM|nr:hypothetical protein [Luteibacter yeojuensis]KJV33812.1 hypothetical protein VI08_10645 [Luteibacter yeojuensis]